MDRRTPGEWHWHQSRTMQHLQGGGRGLGVSAPLPGNRKYGQGHRAEDAANLRLIAAAPELEVALASWVLHSVDMGFYVPPEIASWAKGTWAEHGQKHTKIGVTKIAISKLIPPSAPGDNS